MFKKILLCLVAVVVIFIVIVALQPEDFRIERSATMAAPAEKVFAQVNDFHLWQEWSPWAKIDPDAKANFEGAESGKGAVFKWSGNSDVGEGTMTLIESQPHEVIKIKIDFTKPFENTNTAEFTFKPENNNTVVTWSMSGKRNFIAKAICLFMDMDQMVGGQFEKGLANIESIVATGDSK